MNVLVNELVVQKHLQTVKPTVGRKLWDLVQLQRQNCRRDPMMRSQSDAKEVVLAGLGHRCTYTCRSGTCS